MTTADQPIHHHLDSYRAAVHAKDAAAFAALYDADVRVFDMWGRWSYDGLDVWRAMAAEWFASLGSERVAVTFDDIQIVAGSDLATAHAFVTYTGLSAEGDELRSMQNRLTWVLRREDDIWKIIHEHSSAPVDFETSKVILNR